jgi:glycosyltransferase involved in cell wall biosynthesis
MRSLTDTVFGSSTEREPTERTGSNGSSDAEPLLSFFIPDLTVGGAEQVVVNIVNGLSSRGYNVELLLSRTEGKLQFKLAESVRVVKLSPSPLPIAGVATHIPDLVNYLSRREPAALFPHLNHTSIVSLVGKKLSVVDTKIIPTQHSSFGVSLDKNAKGWVVQKLATRLYPSADEMIAVSNGVADTLVQQMSIQREDISVLHNPVEVEAIRDQADEPVDHEWVEDSEVEVILFVGRLAEQKDLETWLRTFEKVYSKNPNTRGIIVGQGSERKKVTAVAEELGISDVVSIPGYVDNPYRFMEQASVFLLSSRYEGLPTVLIEALACGCPIVSTDCPSGPREILVDGEYGKLVPVGEPNELAEAVIETLADPVASDKLRDRGDDFSPEAVFNQYERFIEEHIGDK